MGAEPELILAIGRCRIIDEAQIIERIDKGAIEIVERRLDRRGVDRKQAPPERFDSTEIFLHLFLETGQVFGQGLRHIIAYTCLDERVLGRKIATDMKAALAIGLALRI